MMRDTRHSLSQGLLQQTLIKGDIGEIENAGMCSTVSGSTWWGHWLEDEMPLQIFVETLAKPVGITRNEYRDES